MEVPRVQTLILLLIALGLPECNAYGWQPQDDAKSPQNRGGAFILCCYATPATQRTKTQEDRVRTLRVCPRR